MAEHEEKGGRRCLNERSYGSFSRSTTLPAEETQAKTLEIKRG